MKKLLLTLYLLVSTGTFIPMSAPADDIIAKRISKATGDSQIPGELDPNFPDLHKINPIKILNVIKSTDATLFEIYSSQTKEYATFETVKNVISKNPYIQGFGPQADALTNLLSYLYSSLMFKPANTIPFYAYSVEPYCCSCIPTEYRVLQAFFTILLIKEKYNSNKEQSTSLNYVSIASGHLKQDYITLSALIKLGIPHMQIAIIDPQYNALHPSELPLLSAPRSRTRSIHERDEMSGSVDYFKILIQQTIKAYQHVNPSATPSALSIMTYKSTKEYLLTIKNNPLAQPHIAVLSDSAGEEPMRSAIWADFREITSIIPESNSIISILDHDLEDKLFVDITKDGNSVVNFNEKDLVLRPKPPIAPKPTLKSSEKSMADISEMLDQGIINLEDAIEKFFTSSMEKMKFRTYYHKKQTE